MVVGVTGNVYRCQEGEQGKAAEKDRQNAISFSTKVRTEEGRGGQVHRKRRKRQRSQL